MTEEPRLLTNPPIVEAILDIDCDVPSGTVVAQKEEEFSERWSEAYPEKKHQFVQSIDFAFGGTSEVRNSAPVLQSLRFFNADNSQLIQARQQGYSFNRLRSYSSLSNYFGEIEKTWSDYCQIVKPTLVRQVRLRFINKIVLPLEDGIIKLDDYFNIGPRVPAEPRFQLTGFLYQFEALDKEFMSQVTSTLAVQESTEREVAILFDIGTRADFIEGQTDWDPILKTIEQLRASKNEVFWRSLTEKCLNLYQ